MTVDPDAAGDGRLGPDPERAAGDQPGTGPDGDGQLGPDAVPPGVLDRRSINRRLAALFRMGDAYITRELRATGLSSGPAYFVLELAVGGTLTLTEVSRRIGVDRAHTTRIARRLVDEGFATRRPDPSDGRGSLLTLTPRGEAAALQVELAIRDWVAVISDGVTPGDIAATNRAFDRFYANATERLGDAGAGSGRRLRPDAPAVPADGDRLRTAATR